MGRDKRKGRAYDEPFLGIVRSVFQAPAYIALGPWACKLLLDVGSQFNGSNNGDLSIPWSRMKQCGWNSRTTLWRARDALVEAGLIHITRRGRRPSVCQLLALTWLPLNITKKFDVEAVANFDFKGYRKGEVVHMPPIRQRPDWSKPNGGKPGSTGANLSPVMQHD